MEERIKKSALQAEGIFDYQKLMYPDTGLIAVKIEEEGEELLLTYNLEALTPMTEIRKEDITTRLAVLENIELLAACRKSYYFTLEPENLYYGRNHLVYVKQRDICGEDREYDEQKWMEEYKALIGYALQKQYSYADYVQGGMQLLKGGILQKVRQVESVEELVRLLEQRKQEIETERSVKMIFLNRRRYRTLQASFVVVLLLAIVLAVYALVDFIRTEPYKDAVIAAENAYISADYVSCVDAMQEISVKDMDIYQKYILANSYVRSENLTQQQKENIISNLSLKETPARLEYWIYLGRNDISEAIDIAMQQSDDEMLLYAYMKQKSMIETDSSLSGEEKTQELEKIAQKMQPLMEKYDTEEE